MKRKIIQIDEEKCNGCGKCMPNCPEGALQLIDGKARLVSDLFLRRARRLHRGMPDGGDHSHRAGGGGIR